MKTIRPLCSESDYERALAEITPYFEKPPAEGTGEADRFDLIATAIEAYERKHWPIEPAPAESLIRPYHLSR
jgi:HTH-type transcriptional regulator/antitoxin HigA